MAIANYLYLSAILFTIGAIGVVVRRNSIVVFMCIELMLNAANLAFVTFARINSNLEGQVIAFFTMVVAACGSRHGTTARPPGRGAGTAGLRLAGVRCTHRLQAHRFHAGQSRHQPRVGRTRPGAARRLPG